MFQNPSDDRLRDILTSAKTIAVVGLSTNPERESYIVAKELQRHGFRIIPVNPNATEVLGEKSYPSLADVPHPIDIIDIFRRSEALPEVVQEAVQTSAPVIWAQEGVFHEEAADLAASANKTIVMDRCIKIAYHQLVSQ